MNKKRLIWIIIGLTVIGGIVLASCNAAAQNGTAAAAGETVTAFIGDLADSATASGQVLPQHEASLSVNSASVVTAVNVRIGNSVQAGDVLIQLDTASLELNVATAAQSLAIAEANLADLLTPADEFDIASAEAAVASAQAQVDDYLAGPTAAEIALAEASVNSSTASVWSASADLGSTRDSITEAQVKAAETAVLSTQIALENAQEANDDLTNADTHAALLAAQQAYADAVATLQELQAGPNVAAAQSSVAAANARLEVSEIDYDETLAGATVVDLASAESQLASAQATLANLVDGSTDAEIRASEAEVEQARISLANAAERLQDASILAPFDGMITEVFVSEGEIASGVVIEMVDSSSLEVVLSVDEVDVGSFTIGQAATISLETWPNEVITSEILAIAPSAAETNSGLVSYDVHLAIGATDLPILVGMTANANLITAEAANVLLVPNQAITPDRAAGKYYVELLQADGTTSKVEVQVGLMDDDFTQITDGLLENDTLVIPNFKIAKEEQGPGNGGPFGG